MRDARLTALLERTTARENAAFSEAYPREWPCRIELKTRGGGKEIAEARYFKGHAQDPLTDAQIDKILTAAWRLEKLADIRELLGLLRFLDQRKKRDS